MHCMSDPYIPTSSLNPLGAFLPRSVDDLAFKISGGVSPSSTGGHTLHPTRFTCTLLHNSKGWKRKVEGPDFHLQCDTSRELSPLHLGQLKR